MSILRLLNFSTHAGDLALFDDDWKAAGRFLEEWDFDGFELYPVGDYPWERIPAGLIKSLHLRFFVILRPGWKEDHREIKRVFGDHETAARFYGGRDYKTAIIEAYRRQLNLAHDLGCETVVFHPAHCELEYIYDWNFPWDWRRTLELCAEVLNESLARSTWRGLLLLENLWWPGSFRLKEPEAEYDYLKSRIEHKNCGIVLDTGHLLYCDNGFDDEPEAIAWLLDEVGGWPEGVRRAVRALHLTCSLSGAYIRESRARAAYGPGRGKEKSGANDFFRRLAAARDHVMRIDRHQAFTEPAIGRLFSLIAAEQAVFEFIFRDRKEWESKIALQKQALQEKLW